MGEHAYDYSSMSPSTPEAQHPGSSRHHTKVPSSKTTTTRPAIRIIHIVAPEIIKTDVANFRDLVQRLTGRQQQEPAPASDDDDARKAVTMGRAPPSPVEEKPHKKRLAAPPLALADDLAVHQENRRRKKIKCEVVKVEEGGFGFGAGGDLDLGELWVDLNPGGFLSFLEEDVFQGMAPEFLQTSLGAPRRDLIGEMCASYLA